MKLVLALWCYLFSDYLYANSCIRYQKNLHHELITSRRQGVFFASWCQACVATIQNSDPEKDLYIVVFDDPDKALSALVSLNFTSKPFTCLWDKDHLIAKEYGVAGLPAVRALKP